MMIVPYWPFVDHWIVDFPRFPMALVLEASALVRLPNCNYEKLEFYNLNLYNFEIIIKQFQ